MKAQSLNNKYIINYININLYFILILINDIIINKFIIILQNNLIFWLKYNIFNLSDNKYLFTLFTSLKYKK